MSTTLLVEVEGLTVEFWNGEDWTSVVDGISFTVGPGEAFGLVGESGCGKTTTAFTLLGYRRPGSRIRAGEARFLGRNLVGLSERELHPIRGGQIALVPQNPTTALSPGMRVGRQLEEAMRIHGVGSSRTDREERARKLLQQVRLPQPARTARKYPHQLSGGQQQRVTIAMALACAPKLVVLDEPTTGLDVTTQAQILDLLRRLREELGTAYVYVTHNLGVVAEICDRVGVMYAGKLVEEAPTAELFRNPRHPYTRGLIAAVPSVRNPRRTRSGLMRGLLQREALPPGCPFAPRCEFALERCFQEPQAPAPVAPGHEVACWRWPEIPAAAAAKGAEAPLPEAPPPLEAEPLLDVRGIELAYQFVRRRPFAPREPVSVVRDVTFNLRPRETFALVGESGSGKSTIARTIGGLMKPLAGQLVFEGRNISQSRTKEQRREIQLVLQNPDASLNPRQRVAHIIGRPLELFYGLKGAGRRRRVAQLLEDVRLDPAFASRFPDELSGGERQRVAIARALAAEPRLMLCDEVLSALDVSVQATVLDLLRALQEEHGIAYLFISHDLAVVRSISHRVGVLYKGELCEVGLVEEVYSPPFHAYTQELLLSVPEIDPAARRTPAPQSDAEATDPTLLTACPFADRCPLHLGPVCDEEPPPWRFTSETHAIRCHIPLDELAQHTVWPSTPVVLDGAVR